jgi:small subunit ribosomal protein S11
LTVFRADPYNPTAGGKWYDVANRRSKTTHILHVKVTRNNVHLSFADARGNLFGTITAGTDKVFKKSNRSTYEAAFQAACKMFAKILDYARGDAERPGHVVQLCVAFNGLQGTGREAIAQAMQGPEGAEFIRLVTRVEDRTPIKMGGPRPRGQRNV